jgi:hypothetical protein
MAQVTETQVWFSGRDLATLDAEMDRQLEALFPEVDGVSHDANPGRRFLSLVEGLVAGLHYSQDRVFEESFLATARLQTNAARIARAHGYYPHDYVGAQVDLTFTSLTGPLAGDETIPAWTVVKARGDTSIQYVTLEDLLIATGEQTGTVSAVQGVRVAAESVDTADGTDYQRYRLLRPYVDARYVVVRVAGVEWAHDETRLVDVDADSQSYWLEFDEDHVCWINFGDNVRGAVPGNGEAIEVDYVTTLGESGVVTPGQLSLIEGAVSSEFSASNATRSAGAYSGESVASIQANTASHEARRARAVHQDDYIAAAESVVGVYSAHASRLQGRSLELAVLPSGGGTASAQLLEDVESYLNGLATLGAEPSVVTVEEAGVLVQATITTTTSGIRKALLRQQAVEAIKEALSWDQVTVGKGPAISDFAAVIERDLANAGQVDRVDFEIFTRKLRLVKSSTSLPDFKAPGSLPSTDSWVNIGGAGVYISQNTAASTVLVTVINSTTFDVAIDGVLQDQGTIGTAYYDASNRLFFKIGLLGDTFDPGVYGETYTYYTSPRSANITIQPTEAPTVQLDTDLRFTVLYPGE